MLDLTNWMPAGANMHDILIFTSVLWTIHQVFAVGTSFFFNQMHKKNWFPNRRFANGKAPPDPLYRSAWKEWFLNHVFILPVFMGFVLYPLFVARGGSMAVPWPSVWEVVIHIAVCVFVNETLFYFSHRFLHNI